MSGEIDKDWLRKSIEAKSDQLNADDLIAGPITVKITGVRRGKTPEQPIAIELDGNKEKPYLPCKGMRRLLIAAWTDDPKTWVGKRMTLYRNPDVMYGGVKLGGIEISSMSDIPPELQIMRTVRRGVKTPLTIKRLADEAAKQTAKQSQKPAEPTAEDLAYLEECKRDVDTSPSMEAKFALYELIEKNRPAILSKLMEYIVTSAKTIGDKNNDGDLTAIYKMVESKRPSILAEVKKLCSDKRKELEAATV